MEEELEVILREILVGKYKRPESEIQAPLSILHENFFFKLGDLEEVDLNLWKELKLPINLFNILKTKIKELKNNEISISGNNTQTNQPTQGGLLNTTTTTPTPTPIQSNITTNTMKIDETSTTNKNDNSLLQNISNSTSNLSNNNYSNSGLINKFTYSDKQVLRKQIFDLLDDVVKECKVKEEYEATLNTLYKIIEKVVQNPKTPQYHKINKNVKTYQTKIQPYKSTVNFLLISGFSIDSDSLFIENPYPRLEELENIRFYFESFLISKSKLDY